MEILNPNRENLERTARALEPILPELVFVGGDVLGSRDIEDLVAVLDGRLDGDLDQDLILAPPRVQKGLGEMARALFGIDDFGRLCIAGLGDREERALGFLRKWEAFA